ncbi:hypothetical protein vseg_003377 [Gypsophila vaccaria]
MGKRANKLIPFLSQSKSLDSKVDNNNQWLFPSCTGNIKTLSFRETANNNNNNNNFYKDDNFKTFNSAFVDTPESLFTVSPSSRSFSTLSDDFYTGDPIESVIRGLRSDRLFFEPEPSCCMVGQQLEVVQKENNCSMVGRQQLEVEKEVGPGDETGWVEESEAMCLESNNPSEDFRRSMEEMVEAHGLKDWQGLEDLLGCYLKINSKLNHAFIMSAFFDLLINLSFISSNNNTITNTNSNTTSTSSSSISSNNINIDINNNNNLNSSLLSPSSPLSLPSSSLTTPSLSSLFDLGDDHCNHDNDDDDNDNR